MGHSEAQLIRESVGNLLASTAGRELPAALEASGWFELWDAEGSDALRPLFGLQGELHVDGSPMLQIVMARPLLDAAGAEAPPASPAFLPLLQIGAPVDGDRVEGVTIGEPGARSLVTALADGSVVGLDPERAEIGPVAGLDPFLGLRRVSADISTAEPLPGVDADAWSEAVDLGRRALAEELLGLAEAALRLAVDHARERRQFGRPIGSFQALQHKLAEVEIELGRARLAVAHGWAEPTHPTALLAKSVAGRAARLAARHGQQALGGVGFTWEHGFHRYARRIHVLEPMLGTVDRLRALSGAAILRDGLVPRVGAL